MLPHEGAYVGSKNTRRNKALHRGKKRSVGRFTFQRINSVTIRIDRRGKNGVGWLMEVGWVSGARQRWVACVGNHRSEPLPLEEAKRAATAMLHKRGKPEHRDWIKELNQQAANEIDRACLAKEKRKWPLNLMGGRQRKPCMTLNPETVDRGLGQVILDTEAGDHQLAQGRRLPARLLPRWLPEATGVS